MFDLPGNKNRLDLRLHGALALAARHEGAPEEEQQRCLEGLRRYQQQLAEGAEHHPKAFRAPERMVAAELARLLERHDEAMRSYEEAIHAARQYGCLQSEALANELAANFWRARRMQTLADAYAREARAAYLRGGASDQLQELETRWPHLAGPGLTVEQLAQENAALRCANDALKRQVEERTREFQETQAQLVDAARAAALAEVAANVLHDVGNVLTSAVVNLEQMAQAVESSRISRVRQLSELFAEHHATLADFLTRDPRGSRLPDYLSVLSEELQHEQANFREALESMGGHIEHLRALIEVQQTYAKDSLVIDEYDLTQLVEEAMRLQQATLQRHGIRLAREFSPLPRVRVDKHKVLQILINLLNNARDAMDAMPPPQRRLTVRLSAEGPVARIEVVDNGRGIAPEVRERLFSHGFTTRKEGHGFGLHSSALAARLLGGQLRLESDGPDRGARATLELPLS